MISFGFLQITFLYILLQSLDSDKSHCFSPKISSSSTRSELNLLRQILGNLYLLKVRGGIDCYLHANLEFKLLNFLRTKLQVCFDILINKTSIQCIL